MRVKVLTKFKVLVMIIVPIIAEITLVVLEIRRVVPPEVTFPTHAALYAFVIISVIRYRRRCYECGAWHTMKETSREEINRMEHPRKNTRRKKRKVYQVRYNVWKKCRRCGANRLDEIIKEEKEK